MSTRRHEPLFQTRYTSLGHTLDTRGTGRKMEARCLGKMLLKTADEMMDGAIWKAEPTLGTVHLLLVLKLTSLNPPPPAGHTYPNW